MPGTSRLVTASVVGVLITLGSVAGAFAQNRTPEPPPAARGVLFGVVTDDNGAPVAGAMVSAIGAITIFAVSDDSGRFEMTAPGSGRLPNPRTPQRFRRLPHPDARGSSGQPDQLDARPG